MDRPPAPVVEHFLTAAQVFAALLEQVPEYRWERPGVGEWDVRGLAGHTARAITTLLTSIAAPAAVVDRVTPREYYAAVAAVDSTDELNEAIRQRGVEAVQALGADPAGQVRGWIEAASAALAATDLSTPVTTAAGGMRLLDYLPTRTFELVVHSLDLSAATGLPLVPPPAALRSCLLLAADVAATKHGEVLLRALTGRGRLPDGFSVVP